MGKKAARIPVSDFRVAPDSEVDLDRWPTRVDAFYRSKSDYKDQLKRSKRRLVERQRMLYAHNRHALLVIFQAMDAAGKDSAIRHVMSGVNPQGCQVHSFKHPSAAELDHDFLWRTHRALPERGRIGIFNRSYYEEVLVVRVDPAILAAQNLPAEAVDGGDIWQGRFHSITESEAHLHRNGTRIVKFFLHVSPREQARRLLARIDDPDKNWKFSSSDLVQRRAWDSYMRAYQECLSATSTAEAPWYAVPADDKRNARLIITQALVETLDDMDLAYPKLSGDQRQGMDDARRSLEAELGGEVDHGASD